MDETHRPYIAKHQHFTAPEYWFRKNKNLNVMNFRLEDNIPLNSEQYWSLFAKYYPEWVSYQPLIALLNLSYFLIFYHSPVHKGIHALFHFGSYTAGVWVFIEIRHISQWFYCRHVCGLYSLFYEISPAKRIKPPMLLNIIHPYIVPIVPSFKFP